MAKRAILATEVCCPMLGDPSRELRPWSFRTGMILIGCRSSALSSTRVWGQVVGHHHLAAVAGGGEVADVDAGADIGHGLQDVECVLGNPAVAVPGSEGGQTVDVC